MEASMERSKKERVGSNLAATRSAHFVDGDGGKRAAAIFGTAEGIVVAAKVRMWPDGECGRQRLQRRRC